MPHVKVKVFADGTLLLDEQPVTLEQVDQRLGELSKEKGIVLYYRELPERDPPPIASQVITLVTKHRLPVSLSSKPDFSDSIDDRGRSHPRANVQR